MPAVLCISCFVSQPSPYIRVRVFATPYHRCLPRLASWARAYHSAHCDTASVEDPGVAHVEPVRQGKAPVAVFLVRPHPVMFDRIHSDSVDLVRLLPYPAGELRLLFEKATLTKEDGKGLG